MGGGTPLIEASRLGLSVIGYDTNAVARWIVERELEELDPDALETAGDRAIARVERKVRSLYITNCGECGRDAPVRYFMWARQHTCVCGAEHPLLSDTMLVSSKMGRHPADVHICPSCRRLAEHPAGGRPDDCPHCTAPYELPLVQEEPQTTAWFAVRFGPTRFAIFDAVPDEPGHDAQLAGQVAAALMERAPEILAEAPRIEKLDVLAEKLPS
jgi:hypothetical protein